MKNLYSVFMLTAATVFAVISFGFIDPNFRLSIHSALTVGQQALAFVVYQRPWIAAGSYIGVIALYYAGFSLFLRRSGKTKITRIPGWLMVVIGISLVSFPALSYDIFNYVATAKVTYFYGENPYIVMPIDIPNEPMLSYTRAANKLALYGPVWIVLSVFPYLLGRGDVLATVFSFKLFAGMFYAAVCYMIYRKTKRWDQTLFFAANPLVVIEVLVNGHNDVAMMALALGGLILWSKTNIPHKVAGLMVFAASVLVKGATLALLPLFFLSGWAWEKKMIAAYWLMFGVFLVSPLREEMYPWYAVWWLMFAALIPITKKSFIHGFSFWLSFGLMLRYIPWIATREYGGMTPIVRIILMILPVVAYSMSFLRGRK